jgi:protein-disulfide isomerase
MSRLWILFAALCLALVAMARLLAPASLAVPPVAGGMPAAGNLAGASAAPAPLPATAQLEATIKAYILANPEVLIKSVEGMGARESGKALENLRAELETAFPGAVAGNPQGDVTVVEFFDFRCPFCHTAHEQVTKLLSADGNVRLVYRDLPILDRPGAEPLSRRAAQLALAAAKQGKYSKFYEAVFANRGRMTQESLVAAVRRAGLDERRAARDMTSDEVRKAIERNLKLASTIGIDGTPGFVIGDELHVGAKDMSELLVAVKRVREKNRQAVLERAGG